MLAKRAERLNNKAKGSSIYGVFDWITLLVTFLPLLGQFCKPKNPEPVNPTPNPTPAQAAAWSKAWEAKSAGMDNWDGDTYKPAAIRRTAAKIRQQGRRDGKPMKKAEAEAAARLALDEGRLSSMPELYGDVLEAQGL